MQRRTIISNGKRLLVNVADGGDGVGAGFATGQLVMKSYTDQRWYVLTASGSAGNVALFVSQSRLPFVPTGSAYYQYDNHVVSQSAATYYEQNSPYQLLACNDGLAYKVYLTGTAPTATFTISQSASGPAFITSSYGATIDIAKPKLLLQNISDFNYYYATLVNNAGTITLVVNQSMVSQSWVRPIY